MNRALIHWYWIMNWNWCFHSSAAGRASSGEGDFDKLTTMNYAPNIGMQNWTRKIPEKGKSGTRKGEKVCIFVSPALFLRSKPVMWRVVAHPGRGIATRSPLSQSGAQSVSRWFLWNSTGYGSSKYMCQIALPTSGERETRLNTWQRDFFKCLPYFFTCCSPTTQHL